VAAALGSPLKARDLTGVIVVPTAGARQAPPPSGMCATFLTSTWIMCPGRRAMTPCPGAGGSRATSRRADEDSPSRSRPRDDRARNAGISPETLRKIEVGRMPDPSFGTVIRLCTSLGMALQNAVDAWRGTDDQWMAI
jgi:DNA-binding XRE family transcriptional regulator